MDGGGTARDGAKDRETVLHPGALEPGDGRQVRIVHFSDIHAGSQYFVPNLLNRALVEINDLAPDIVVITGDLTNMGFRQEYREARSYLDRLACPDVIVVPGNHDSRNVGYLHFERLFSRRDRVLHKKGVTIVGVDSTEPDLDYGRIGRHRYEWIRGSFAERPDTFRIFALHHHLLPVPGTGRERNVVQDAGDVLEMLLQAEVKLVLSGHKHVPYVWRLDDMFVVNTGTVSTLRLRGDTKPCYGVIDIVGPQVTVTRRYPFHGEENLVEFDADAATYTRHGLHLDRIITDV
jgi:Icc protein